MAKSCRDEAFCRLVKRKELLIFVVGLFTVTYGHGRLMDPPGRGSLWRFVDTNPLLNQHRDQIKPDYTDNGLNCGGLSYQTARAGLCGVLV